MIQSKYITWFQFFISVFTKILYLLLLNETEINNNLNSILFNIIINNNLNTVFSDLDIVLSLSIDSNYIKNIIMNSL